MTTNNSRGENSGSFSVNIMKFCPCMFTFHPAGMGCACLHLHSPTERDIKLNPIPTVEV